MSDLLTRLKELKPPQKDVQNIEVRMLTPTSFDSFSQVLPTVTVDLNTVSSLSSAIFKVVGKDYTDYVYRVCTSAPSYLSMCRLLREAVEKCNDSLIPKLVPTMLDDLVKYVKKYISKYCFST